MKQNKTIILIGAEGFLGKKLGTILLKNGYDLIGIDIKKADKKTNYTKFIQKNIYDITVNQISFLKDIEYYGFIYVGGVSRNSSAAKFPAESTHNTITSFIKFLELLDNTPPKWMMITSTREVDILLNNKKILNGKQKIYPSLKLAAELISESFQSHWQIPLKIFRLSDIFGIGDHPSKVMQIFLNKAIKNEDIYVHNLDLKLFLTEVNEVSKLIYKYIAQIEMSNQLVTTELLNLWDNNHSISLLELAHLVLELNPNSTSQIITDHGIKLGYSIKEKIKPDYLVLLNKLNQNLTKYLS